MGDLREGVRDRGARTHTHYRTNCGPEGYLQKPSTEWHRRRAWHRRRNLKPVSIRFSGRMKPPLGGISSGNIHRHTNTHAAHTHTLPLRGRLAGVRPGLSAT